MITTADLKKIAQGRLKDAEVLFAAGRYDGAIYLSGYVVEVALKCRICETLKWSGFPQSNNEFKSYQSFKTHDLEVLLKLSGVEQEIKATNFAEWSAVTSWNPETRYNPVGQSSQPEAELMIEAVTILLEAL